MPALGSRVNSTASAVQLPSTPNTPVTNSPRPSPWPTKPKPLAHRFLSMGWSCAVPLWKWTKEYVRVVWPRVQCLLRLERDPEQMRADGRAPCPRPDLGGHPPDLRLPALTQIPLRLQDASGRKGHDHCLGRRHLRRLAPGRGHRPGRIRPSAPPSSPVRAQNLGHGNCRWCSCYCCSCVRGCCRAD